MDIMIRSQGQSINNINDDLWKHILSFAVSYEETREKYINFLIKLSMVCKNTALFVRGLWSKQESFYNYIYNWELLKYTMDPFTATYMHSPFSEFYKKFDPEQHKYHRNIRALATVKSTRFCSLCNNEFPNYILKKCISVGKAICPGCVYFSFVTYKELFCKFNIDLSKPIPTEEESVPPKKKQKRKKANTECLLSYYFKNGGFGLRFPPCTSLGKERRNAQFCADEFGHIVFKGPIIVLWKPDVHRILNITKFGIEKRELETSGKVIKEFVKRRLNEKILEKAYRKQFYAVATGHFEEESVWAKRIVRNLIFSKLSRANKHLFYSHIMKMEKGFNIFEDEKNQDRDYYDEHAKSLINLDMPHKKLIDSIGKKFHNQPSKIKPGPQMQQAMEKWCSELLNHGFGMSDTDYLFTMEMLLQNMTDMYEKTTWAIC